MSAVPVQVLKFGSSVLRGEAELADAVHEIYRQRRKGHAVLAVVSALAGTTDRLLEASRRLNCRPGDEAVAALLATGEAEAVALLHVALDRAGVPSHALDAATVALRVRGERLDAEPVGADWDLLRARLQERGVVVVPGFVGVHEEGGTALLGRGGSDLSALFLAHGLGARCTLVKDVPGLYASDPAAPGPAPGRYAAIRFEDAARLDGAILQRKALRFAAARDFRFRVGACADRRRTRVGARCTRVACDPAPRGPLRVALFGLGTVGSAVAAELAREPGRWQVVGAVVRDPARPRALPRGGSLPLHAEPGELLAARPDVVVHAAARDARLEAALAEALGRGIDVVTADKELVARRGAEFRALAARSRARFLYGAAVGGAAPMVEAVRAARRRASVQALEGVLNGTTTYLLDRLAGGAPWSEALADAQALGFAEADPSADVDGHDAARKLTVLAREAWGVTVDADTLARVPLGEAPCPRDAAADGCVVRLVARAELQADGSVVADVRPRRLSAGHPLAAARDESNVLRILLAPGGAGTGAGADVAEPGAAGREVRVGGRGAGGGPTAEAVLGDLFELWRAPCARESLPGTLPAVGGDPDDAAAARGEVAA